MLTINQQALGNNKINVLAYNKSNLIKFPVLKNHSSESNNQSSQNSHSTQENGDGSESQEQESIKTSLSEEYEKFIQPISSTFFAFPSLGKVVD